MFINEQTRSCQLFFLPQAQLGRTPDEVSEDGGGSHRRLRREEAGRLCTPPSQRQPSVSTPLLDPPLTFVSREEKTYSSWMTRISSSRSCRGLPALGAPMSRSRACWFIEERDPCAGSTRRRRYPALTDVIHADGSHAAVRRGAELERAIHAAELLLDVRLAIEGDLERFTNVSGLAFRMEGLDADLRESRCISYVLERLEVWQRIFPAGEVSASILPAASEKGCARQSTRFSSSFRSYEREVDDPAARELVLGP